MYLYDHTICNFIHKKRGTNIGFVKDVQSICKAEENILIFKHHVQHILHVMWQHIEYTTL